MTFDKLISICNPLKVSGSKPDTLGELVQDSRRVTPGDVFIAIRGTQSDGHDYIDMAVSKGAAVVIVEELQNLPEEIFQIVVSDTRKLISPLALAFFDNPQEEITCIGITGTNGKTTVSTIVYQILTHLGYKTALLGTVEKRIGKKIYPSKLTTSGAIELAKDLRNIADADCRYVVMEVSSHALDQDRASGIPFKIGAFTNLSHDHLDYHKTIEAYAKAKKKLFDSLNPGSVAIINNDDARSSFMTSDTQAEVWPFGFNNKTKLSCKIISNTASGLTVEVDGMEIHSPLTGEFNAYNIAEAYLICSALGYSKSKIASAVSSAHGAPGRLEKIMIKNGSSLPSVFVDYAHTPDALEKVSKTLAQVKTQEQKLYIVFGCGGNRDVSKRPVMGSIAETYGDIVITTSDNPRFEDPEKIIDDIMPGYDHPERVIRESDRKKAIEYAINAALPEDIILVAGKGHEDYQEIEGERHHFDDREIARETLSKYKHDLKPNKEAR